MFKLSVSHVRLGSKPLVDITKYPRRMLFACYLVRFLLCARSVLRVVSVVCSILPTANTHTHTHHNEKISPLKNAPHTWEMCFEDDWDKPYTRTQAAFPAPWVKSNKFWPTVGRVDNVHGDRNLVRKQGGRAGRGGRE